MDIKKTSGLNYNTSNLRVCVDASEYGGISGRVYSMRLSAPIEFTDVSDFILKVETVLDTQNFPQSFQRKRVFYGGDGSASPYVGDAPLDKATVDTATGKLFTFTVQILSRMNTTWQGQIDWLDGGEKPRFMSALQFIELVDKRISELA